MNPGDSAKLVRLCRKLLAKVDAYEADDRLIYPPMREWPLEEIRALVSKEETDLFTEVK